MTSSPSLLWSQHMGCDPILTSVELLGMGDIKRDPFLSLSIKKKLMWCLELRSLSCNKRGRPKMLRKAVWGRTSLSWTKSETICPDFYEKNGGFRLPLVEYFVTCSRKYHFIVGPKCFFSSWVSYFRQKYNYIPNHSDLKASCHFRALSCHCCPYTISTITILKLMVSQSQGHRFYCIKQKSNTK